jgi:hypothetical protein
MIEHKPWKGPDYKDGICGGQRIAVVGYSHYEDFQDHNGLTVEIVRRVIAGCKYSFFTQICGYFNESNDFWDRVLFFNYLPNIIGSAAKRYDRGSKEQIARAQERFIRIISKHQPHKVLVFTGKGWSSLPSTREEERGTQLKRISPKFPSFSWGTHDIGGVLVMTFGLRHPQGANADVMRAAVRTILNLQVMNADPVSDLDERDLKTS